MNPALILAGSSRVARNYLLAATAVVVIIVFLPLVAVAAAISEPTAKPDATVSESKGALYTGPLLQADTYAYGNCTYWVFLRRRQINELIPNTWGNANTWASRAAKGGYIVNNSPSPGAIMQTTAGEFGHVAFVEDMASNGNWTISEMNVDGWDIVDDRTLPPSAASNYRFIHQLAESP